MIIGIVDDEVLWAEKIKEYIEEYLALVDVKDYRINLYADEKNLLPEVDNIDLLFLDVELADGKNGFDIAEHIQQLDCNMKICFLTSHIEFARLGYKVNAFRYIDKLHLEEIDEALASYILTFANASYIDCKNALGVECKINLGEVIYIEKLDRKICYRMKDGAVYYNEGNLKDIAAEYQDIGLILIQRSFVINMKYVDSYDSRQVTLLGGISLNIGRDRLQDFKKRYFDYRRKM